MAYTTLAELQRVLQKPSPTAAEQQAMQRVIDAAATEINWDLGFTADPSPPFSAVLVDVNLDRALELWKFNYSPLGTIPVGPDSIPIVSPRDSWYRHHLRLNPLRTSWGVG